MGCCNSNKDAKMLCYCFNISTDAYQEALKNNQHQVLKDFVIWQTKHNYCNCPELNPSVQCCLKDFKKMEKEFFNGIQT